MRAVPVVAALGVTAVMGAALGGFGGPAVTVAQPVGGSTDVPGLRGANDGTLTISRSVSREPLTPERRPRAGAAVAQTQDRTRRPVEPPVTEVTSAQVVDHVFMTADLNVWSGPGETSTLIDVLPAGTKVPVTGEVVDGQWAEISYQGLSRWVNAAYLAEEKPQAESPTVESGLSAAPCASGSEVESGLMPNAVAVHRAVCAAFPEVTSYGGLRPGDDGEHGQGLALDVMVSGALGDRIAEFVRANSGALGVSEVLWEQQIWTVERSSEGWRALEDRGSVTANHYDHVHVTVYG
jgi:hypothetical protein